MDIRIHLVLKPGTDKGLASHIHSWADEVLGRAGLPSPPPCVHITIWKTMEEFEDFYRSEDQALGGIAGGEMDFLATHDAWRGYPRINICQQRLTGIPTSVVQGVVHHEISHALHHGRPEFYIFRFSKELQGMARSRGLTLPLLQHCVYLLSVAIKDSEVVQWLVEIGLGFSQRALLEHVISDTDEERRLWEEVRTSPALRKVALGGILKTLLPIEAMISSGAEGAQALRNQWMKAYWWLSESEREGLSRFARSTVAGKGGSFQERLGQVTLRLITDSFL